MEADAEADAQLRRALRHRARLHQGIAAQPARQSRVERDAAHDAPHRLCAQLHAAAAGADRAGDRRAVQRHDQAIGDQVRRSGQGRARALFRRRRRAALQRRVQARPRRLLQDQAQPARRGPVRRGGRPCRRSIMPRAMPGASSSAAITRTGRSTFMPTSPAATRRPRTSSRANISSRRTSSPISTTITSSPTIRRNGPRRAAAATRSTTASARSSRPPTSSTPRAFGPTIPTGSFPTAASCQAIACSTPASRRTSTARACLKGVTIRADVLNLFDKNYQIRSGAGVGVGAPQWGQRRGFFAGITKKF